MKWRITGADRATGEDKTITVEADDERLAALRAKESNLLVEKLELERIAPPLEYRGPIAPAKVYNYPDITSNASALIRVSVLFSVFGWFCVIGVIGCFVGMIAIMADPPRTPEGGGALVSSLMIGALVCFFWCAPMFGAAAVMRMLASMGCALRDMTRNSYRD